MKRSTGFVSQSQRLLQMDAFPGEIKSTGSELHLKIPLSYKVKLK